MRLTWFWSHDFEGKTVPFSRETSTIMIQQSRSQLLPQAHFECSFSCCFFHFVVQFILDKFWNFSLQPSDAAFAVPTSSAVDQDRFPARAFHFLQPSTQQLFCFAHIISVQVDEIFIFRSFLWFWNMTQNFCATWRNCIENCYVLASLFCRSASSWIPVLLLGMFSFSW